MSESMWDKTASIKRTGLKEELEALKPHKGTKFDSEKVRMELISPIAMKGLAQVLTKGAKKYAPGNWRKGMKWSRVVGSLKRHLNEYMQGRDYDIDPNCDGCKSGNCLNHTGELHIDQVLCNAHFLSEYFRTHPELDDRTKVDENGKLSFIKEDEKE